MTLHSEQGRSFAAQLATARVLLAQFTVQIEEFEGMNRAQRRTARGRDLESRIDGLRKGRKTWAERVAALEVRMGGRDVEEHE